MEEFYYSKHAIEGILLNYPELDEVENLDLVDIRIDMELSFRKVRGVSQKSINTLRMIGERAIEIYNGSPLKPGEPEEGVSPQELGALVSELHRILNKEGVA